MKNWRTILRNICNSCSVFHFWWYERDQQLDAQENWTYPFRTHLKAYFGRSSVDSPRYDHLESDAYRVYRSKSQTRICDTQSPSCRALCISSPEAFSTMECKAISTSSDERQQSLAIHFHLLLNFQNMSYEHQVSESSLPMWIYCETNNRRARLLFQRHGRVFRQCGSSDSCWYSPRLWKVAMLLTSNRSEGHRAASLSS